MEILVDLVFDLVGEAVVALGLHAVRRLFIISDDLGADGLQTLFSHHPLRCGGKSMAR